MIWTGSIIIYPIKSNKYNVYIFSIFSSGFEQNAQGHNIGWWMAFFAKHTCLQLLIWLSCYALHLYRRDQLKYGRIEDLPVLPLL